MLAAAWKGWTNPMLMGITNPACSQQCSCESLGQKGLPLLPTLPPQVADFDGALLPVSLALGTGSIPPEWLQQWHMKKMLAAAWKGCASSSAGDFQ